MKRFCALVVLLLAACSRGRPEVPILNYHSVGAATDAFTVPLPAFEEQLDWLAANGYHTGSLHELLESRETRRPLPPRSVILTFDDGKEDAARVVLPALRKRGMRGTFFVVTGNVGRPGSLTWDGVRALAAAGMEIGSHTVTHARLPDLFGEPLDAELRESRAELQAQLKQPVEALAYPYNSVRRRVQKVAAAAGYKVAVAGMEHGTDDALRLRRFTVTGSTRLQDFAAACRQ